MNTNPPTDPTWRVTAKGSDSDVRDLADPAREREQMQASRWMEEAAPRSFFSVERLGSARHEYRVVAALTVVAADPPAAELLARSLFEQALPSVGFTDFAVEHDTVDRVMRYP